MAKIYHISEKQAEELKAARKTNKDKKIDNRLKALLMRAEGKANKQIAEACEYSQFHVSKLVSLYCNQGLGAIVENHYAGNRRNMSIAEEEAFLATYKELASLGQIIEVSVIKKAYEEKVGHRIGRGQIYRVLQRHGWRKIMPRSKHTKKASDEVIEASKKLRPSA